MTWITVSPLAKRLDSVEIDSFLVVHHLATGKREGGSFMMLTVTTAAGTNWIVREH